MKYLIFGAAGQDGTIAAEQLQERGDEVWAAVRVRPAASHPLFGSISQSRLLEVDVTDRKSVHDVIQRSSPDRILHLAGLSHVGRSWANPAEVLHVNTVGVLQVFQAVIALGLVERVRIYHASSSEIFGRPSSEPQNEHAPLRPVTPYGVSKAAAHQLAQMFRERHGIWCASGILYNHESVFRSEEYVVRHVTASVARIALGRQAKLRIGDINARRDWGYAPEYVSGMLAMLEQPDPDDFVLATGVTRSVGDLIAAAFGAVGISDYESRLAVDQDRMRAAEPWNLVGDATHAFRSFGWRPRISFEEMVKILVQFDVERLT